MSNISNIKGAALEAIKQGLSPLLVSGDKGKLSYKRPNHKWKDLQRKALTTQELEELLEGKTIRPEFEYEDKGEKKYGITFWPPKVWMLGTATGSVSGSLEVVDVDTKHDNTGTLWLDLETLIKDNLPDLYPLLTISKTQSGGRHLLYRCERIEGNKKLSNRPATAEELEVDPNEKQLCTIETRGEGGYIVLPPSEGYQFTQGDLSTIPTITPNQREILIAICKSFDQMPQVAEPTIYRGTPLPPRDTRAATPFDAYNESGDVLSLLQSHGWKVVRDTTERVVLKRPAATSPYSGNYHKSLKLLRVFSSSTPFDTSKAYSPAGVYTVLECHGDFKEAYRKLLAEGYGSAIQRNKERPLQTSPAQTEKEVISVSMINIVNTKTRETIATIKAGDTIEPLSLPAGDAYIEDGQNAIAALDILEGHGRRCYVKTPDFAPISGWQYRLQNLLQRYYETAIGQGGHLSDPDIDRLLEEVIDTQARIASPIDRDRYKKLFMDSSTAQELGLTGESWDITLKRLTTTRDKAAQEEVVRELLEEANRLPASKALDLLEAQIGRARMADKATAYGELLLIKTEQALRDAMKSKPDPLPSGYTVGKKTPQNARKEERVSLDLPTGAVSVFTAPTSHGKTSMLMNVALNVVKTRPAQEVYFFSYEEAAEAILIKTLNTYIGEKLSEGNRRSLQSYYKTGNDEMIEREKRLLFKAKREEFFRDLIDTGRLQIRYTDYNSEELIGAIRYLHKHANPAAIFIDYFQLLDLPTDKQKATYSRQEQLKAICIALKDVAVETGLPIILGAQFNREVTNAARLHPTKIGEAGDIERIVSLLVGMWNGNFSPALKGITEAEADEINLYRMSQKGQLWAEVLKQRDGEVGLIARWSFDGNTGVIRDTPPDENNSDFLEEEKSQPRTIVRKPQKRSKAI